MREGGIGTGANREKKRERERSSQEMVEVEEQHSNQYRASRAKPSLDYSVCRSVSIPSSLPLSLFRVRSLLLSLSLLVGHTDFSLSNQHEYDGCMNATAPLTGTSPRARRTHRCPCTFSAPIRSTQRGATGRHANVHTSHRLQL